MIDAHRLMQGDCLERMAEIPAGSVDLILCDPPYGAVAGIGDSENIKHGMKGKTAWDSAIDPAHIFAESSRILRPNGALVLFSQEPYTSSLITRSIDALPFSYRMVWVKDHFANALLAKKAPVSYFEDVSVFFKKHSKHDFGGGHPLRDYAAKVLEYIGKGRNDVNKDLGHTKTDHFFRTGSTQFALCTEQVYAELCCAYGLNSMPGFMSFAEMLPINKAYRDHLIQKMTDAAPKVFNLPAGQKFKSNILTYKKDYDGLHPTQKPVALLEDLLTTYSRVGDTVLDFTMGSGSTGVACVNEDRRFIGIERDPGYFRVASDRIAEAARRREAETEAFLAELVS